MECAPAKIHLLDANRRAIAGKLRIFVRVLTASETHHKPVRLSVSSHGSDELSWTGGLTHADSRMKYLTLGAILSGVLAALVGGACASQNKDDQSNTAAASSGVGGSSFQIFPASSAGTGTASPYGWGPFADTTANGTVGISAEKYETLTKDLGSVCQGTAIEVEADQSVIEFLVDVSGSMLVQTPSTMGKTKWEVTRTAIKDAIRRIPPKFGIGLSFYPNMDLAASMSARPVTACIDSSKDVSIDLASTAQLQRISDALDGITPYQYAATPTLEAFVIATDHLKRTTIPGKRYVVLITDGQPTQGEACIGSGGTCDKVTPTPTAPIVTTIAAAAATNDISTFVVGSPGSEKTVCDGVDTRGWLSEAAFYGGTGATGCNDAGPNYCHFDVSQATDFGAALTNALGNITRSLISCSYEVPRASGDVTIDPAKTNLLFDSGANEFFTLLPTLEGCEKGWRFSDASYLGLEICGTTCESLQNNPAAKLTILFGCTTESVIQ